jgi:hypothetical protein
VRAALVQPGGVLALGVQCVRGDESPRELGGLGYTAAPSAVWQILR